MSTVDQGLRKGMWAHKTASNRAYQFVLTLRSFLLICITSNFHRKVFRVLKH